MFKIRYLRIDKFEALPTPQIVKLFTQVIDKFLDEITLAERICWHSYRDNMWKILARIDKLVEGK